MELLYIAKWGGTLDLVNNSLFWLTNVDNMTAATTDISSVVIGGVDGDVINNIQAQPRGIIFDLRIKASVNVEQAKRAVLNIVKLKQKCSLKWTQNNRTLVINGVVDGVTMPRFNNEVTMQISLHCAQPFWEDLNAIISEISEAISLHYFTDYSNDMLFFPADGIPFGAYDFSRTRTLNNMGDVAVGMTIEILAVKTVTNPIIYDRNGNFFGVGYGSRTVTMYAGDIMTINTNIGEKSVTLNGVSQFDKIKPRSTWLMLEAGENEFSINSDDSDADNMIFTMSYKQRYI
jgi:hypothetical protein